MKLVHWLLMRGLLDLVQRGGDWAEPHPSTASVPITVLLSVALRFHVPIKGLNSREYQLNELRL